MRNVNNNGYEFCQIGIRFAAVKVWNHPDESYKHLPLKAF